MNIALLKKSAVEATKNASNLKELEAVRVKYLGRKGELTKILRSLKNLSLTERRQRGSAANKFKKELEGLIAEKVTTLKERAASKVRVDVTRPGEKITVGHLHPLTQIERKVRDVFTSLNFSIIDGPEIENEYYNFDALNIPPDHPARDMWDTFWLRRSKGVGEKLLLRTHTSPMQIRYMQTHQPPFQIIVPGRVFRYEATDVSHEINFYQVEGLMVGKNISLANFKYIVEEFLKRLFGSQVEFRFKPGYFPFVEPGLEVDIKLSREHRLGGEWLEIMGAGMVHPNVFNAVRYNPNDVQGFAFGVGLDRLAMIQYNIPDIRLFYSGDLRFIRQF